MPDVDSPEVEWSSLFVDNLGRLVSSVVGVLSPLVDSLARLVSSVLVPGCQKVDHGGSEATLPMTRAVTHSTPGKVII